MAQHVLTPTLTLTLTLTLSLSLTLPNPNLPLPLPRTRTWAVAVDRYSFVDNPRMRLPSLVFALAYYLHTGACIFFAIAPPSMDELDELESPMEQYSWAFGRVVAFTIGSAYASSGALNPSPLPSSHNHSCLHRRTHAGRWHRAKLQLQQCAHGLPVAWYRCHELRGVRVHYYGHRPARSVF